MFPTNNSTSAGRFPKRPALPTSKYYQPVWLPPGHRTLLALLARRVLQAWLEPDGSPLFTWNPLIACRRQEPRKHTRMRAMTLPGVLPSPKRDKVGCFHHDRFWGYLSVHCCSGLRSPCLRFAMPVAGHHARLGTRLPARLYRGRHLRRLASMRLKAQPAQIRACAAKRPPKTAPRMAPRKTPRHD